MTREEYDSQLEKLEKEFENAKFNLAREFALSNNPYKIGDIIEDHIGKGKILSWSLYYDTVDYLPKLVYKCDNFTLKGEINKKEPIRKIYQSNIKNN